MKLRKILALVLCVALVCSTMGLTVFAGTSEELNGADFDANGGVVFDGVNYYSSLTEALSGVHGEDGAVLYCKPGADLGSMTHGHVCKNLTVYGNGAYLSGGEQDFEIDMYKCPGIDSAGSSLTGDVTLTVYALTGAGTWGTRHSDYAVNYIFEDCESMGKIYLTGDKGSNNITLTNCTFTGNDVSSCKVYSNAAGTIILENVDFTDIEQPVALNNKSKGTQTIVMNGCDFVNCGSSSADWTVPVSVKSSNASGNSVLTVDNCTFSGTNPNSIGQDADILFDYGAGSLTSNIFNTAAKVGVETEANVADYAELSADTAVSMTNTSADTTELAALVNGEYYSSLSDAIDAANAGDTVEIISSVTVSGNVSVDSVNLIAAEGVSITNNGVIAISGECSLNLPSVTGETIDFMDGAVIFDSCIGGEVFVAGNVTFRGENTFDMLYDYGTLTDYYNTTANMEWTVEEGASVTLTKTARYGLGYGDNVTVNGNIRNALNARNTLSNDDASLFMHGLVAQESKGWNCNSSLNINDAYVIIGSNNSFGNKPGNYGGTYNFNFVNSVVDASRITFYEALSETTFNITGSDVKTGTFMTRDTDSVFNITNSIVESTATSNGNDEGNYNAGQLNLVNSDLTYNATVDNAGTITVDLESSFTAPKITGAGKINIDASAYNGYGEVTGLINADLTGFTGNISVINSEIAAVEMVNGEIVVKSSAPVGDPVIGYVDEGKIWGETRANAKESYVIKIYSGDTLLGQSALKNIGGIIDGDVCPTWNIKLDAASNNDEYWDMSWQIAPSMEYQPTHVALVVDGVEVSKTKIQFNGPDNLNVIYAAITDDDGKILSYQTSVENTFAKVKNGETIQLLKDVELTRSISFAKDMEITFNGNGHTVKPAKGSAEGNSAFNLGQGSDSTRASRKYNIENVVFDGWTTDHVIRLQGTTSVVENCTFINCNQPDGLGLVTITFADVIVDNCVFEDNTCVECVNVNSWGDGSVSDSIVKNSVFTNNVISGPGVVHYNDGASLTVEGNKFTSNVVNTNGNAAVVYMGFNNGIVVKDNLFENNTVTTSYAKTARVAGAVFAGFAGDNCEISSNAFVNNIASANGASAANSVAYSAAYAPGNLDGNYWGGNEPVIGSDFTHESSGTNDLTVEEYYAAYSVDADGNLILSDIKAVVSKVIAVQYVKNAAESDSDNGLLVYDIVIVAKDEHVINRLNTVDLTFVQSSDKVAYEIIPADDITLTHNTDYPNRYMFNFDGKDNVADTDVALTVGQVRFVGYDSFTFKVADVSSNLVTATTVDDNIVTYYQADGLVLNSDIDGDGEYIGVINTEIAVPVRTLTIDVTFPNVVFDQVKAYQDMKITISGGDLDEAIVKNLGTDDVAMTGDKYTVSADLTKNNTYNIKVEGAGYRTGRYTVTMTDNKTVTFWNNVMDDDKAMEVNEVTNATKGDAKINFLAGDIVKDNNINIYDLSAVVSYFATTNDTSDVCDYAKYDLNRDGVIDSKDVAYVLVSWNN